MTVAISHLPESGHFVAQEGDKGAGFIEYKLRGTDMAILHTIVDPAFEGQGVGSILVKDALDAARAEQWDVLPYCPFVQSYIRKHPEYQDLVPAGRRVAFGLADD
jgi:predicted GNAT family acetyltransferase